MPTTPGQPMPSPPMGPEPMLPWPGSGAASGRAGVTAWA